MLADGIFQTRTEDGFLHESLMGEALVPNFMALVRDSLRGSLDFSYVSSTAFHELAGHRGGRSIVNSYFLLESMRNRTTTRSDDEPIVLAVAFQIDTKLLTSVNDEQRMAAFYKSMGQIPAQWLFLGLPTLSVQGFRWAPKTLLLRYMPQGRGDPQMTPDYHCQVTDDGLLASLSVIRLEKVHSPQTGSSAHVVEYQENGSCHSSYCAITSCGLGAHDYEETTWDKRNPRHDLLILQDVSFRHHDGAATTGLLARTVHLKCSHLLTAQVTGAVDIKYGSLEHLRTEGASDMSYKGHFTAEEGMHLV